MNTVKGCAIAPALIVTLNVEDYTTDWATLFMLTSILIRWLIVLHLDDWLLFVRVGSFPNSTVSPPNSSIYQQIISDLHI